MSLKFTKPILPPRLPSPVVPKHKPMPSNFSPILRLATVETAAKYGISRVHLGKWYREWLKLRPSVRNFDLQEGKES